MTAAVRPAGHPPAPEPAAERLLRTPAGRAVAGHLGEAVVRADLATALQVVDAAVHAAPLVIPPAMADVFSGGKRIRPLLVVATARAAAASGPRTARAALGPLRPPPTTGRRPGAPPLVGYGRVALAAAAVELLHLASLVHDDIMDEAPTRHGVGTISARGGTGLALVAGDYLLGHAHAAAAALGAGGLLARSLVRLCEGQAEEWSTTFDPRRTVPSYYAAIGGKTAALVEAATRLGALAARHSPRTTAALGRFGHHLGLAFQLRDDLLDLTATADTLGKPVGHDLANGVYTYPTLWALRYEPALAPLLRARSGRAPDQALTHRAAELVRRSGGLEATRRAIRHHQGRCLTALSAAEGLAPEGVTLLADLTEAVLQGG
ncbi:polyprenyl synthetase family protein [Kitasatospora sp. NPDC002227]|uniref:polyprenyl synthetase family protein n=1 Tax=Kitasatospora sp. NPDC002227 TaxID=3154773 RepID=UPI00332C5E76